MVRSSKTPRRRRRRRRRHCCRPLSPLLRPAPRLGCLQTDAARAACHHDSRPSQVEAARKGVVEGRARGQRRRRRLGRHAGSRWGRHGRREGGGRAAERVGAERPMWQVVCGRCGRCGAARSRLPRFPPQACPTPCCCLHRPQKMHQPLPHPLPTTPCPPAHNPFKPPRFTLALW